MLRRGPLIGSGRDADIYDLGGGRVLRVARNGRSLAGEASVMAHAHTHGAPVPAVHDLTDDGGIVMDRVTGPSMLEAADPAMAASTCWPQERSRPPHRSGPRSEPLRTLLVRSFLSSYERAPIEAVLPVIAERRLADPNVTSVEAARVRALMRGIGRMR